MATTALPGASDMPPPPPINYRKHMEQLGQQHLSDLLSVDQIAVLSDHELTQRLQSMSVTIPLQVMEAMSNARLPRPTRHLAQLQPPLQAPKPQQPATATTTTLPVAVLSTGSSSTSSSSTSSSSSASSSFSSVGSSVSPATTTIVTTAQQPLSSSMSAADTCAVLHQRFTEEMRRYAEQLRVAEDMRSLPHKPEVIAQYDKCVTRTYGYLTELCGALNAVVEQLAKEHTRLTVFEDERILKPQLADAIFYDELHAERASRVKQLNFIQTAFQQQQQHQQPRIASGVANVPNPSQQ